MAVVPSCRSSSMPSIRAFLFVLFLALPSAAAAQTAVPNGAAASDTTVGSAAGAVVTPPVSSPDHEALAPRAQAVPAGGEIRVDGVLDEPTWRNAPAITDFR